MGFSKRSRNVLAAATLPVLFAITPRAGAGTTFYFDGDGAGTQDGGAGNWNTTDARWSATDEGTTFLPWTNNAGDPNSAVFDDVAGTVTVGTVTVNSITFSPNPSAAYTLSGGTITFAGPNPTITVNTTGTTNTTLSSVYTGTGPLTKMGAGRLELNASTNTLSGGYILNQGFINLAAANRLGAGAAVPGSLDTDWFTFNGGGLTSSNGAAQDLGATRGITLQSGGAWLGASGANNPVTISAPITGTGSITIASNSTTGSPLNSSFASGGLWTLSNTSNDWNGNLTVAVGRVILGASGVIPDGTAVSLTGTTAMDVNGKTETIGALTGAGGVALNGGTLKVSGHSNPTAPNYTGAISGTGNVVKTGPGVQEFGGVNSFTGGLTVEDGTLRLRSGNNRVPVATLVTIGGASTQGKLLLGVTTNSRDQEISGLVSAGLGGFVGNGASTVATQFATLTINNPVNRVFAGVLGGAGPNENNLNLVKVGAGVQTLSGANTYVGATTVLGGTLRLEGGSMVNSNISVNTGGTFDGGTLGGDLTFNIANDTADLINLTGTGTFDISDFDLLVSLSGTQTAGEYVMANAIVGSANILGSAFKTETLPTGWSIDYDGTVANPTSIVLIAVPEPGTAGLALVAGAALALRRRRRA